MLLFALYDILLNLLTDLVPVSYLSKRFQCKEIVMRHHGLGSQGTFPIAKALVVSFGN